jgi:hypothetical protein
MQTEIKKSPTVENEGQTETSKSQPAKKERQTKTEKRPALDNKGGRPAKEGTEPPKWTIRGVDLETRSIIDKATKKQGLTLGEFFNQDIREYCTGQIKKSQQPPATQNDVKIMVQSELTVFKTELLEALAEREARAATTEPEAERKGFWARLFSK